MRYLFYMRQGTGAESIFYDSEAGDKEYAIAQPTLKLELSKAGTLEFTILPTHPMYNNFTKMKTYIRITQDDDEIFRGRVLSIEDTTYMERKISCEGDLSYLIDSLQPPQSAVAANTTTTLGANNSTARASYGEHIDAASMTTQKIKLGEVTHANSALSAQFAKYINQHNGMVDSEKRFTIGIVNVTTNEDMDFSASGYRDTKSAIDSDLVKQFGGYLQTRKNVNGATYIDWLKEPGTASAQQIVLGVNMIDLQQEAQGDELFTVFVPIGDSDMTIASVNGGNIGIEDTAGVAKYGKIYKTESYSGVSDPAALLKLGKAYMSANYKPNKLQLKVKAVDLHLLDGSVDTIRVGSKVTVISEPHGIETTLTCISIEYDIQNPENNQYEIGDPEESLSQKTHTKAVAAEQATASASRSASRANSSASSLEAAVNRHADNIIDQANSTYKLEADLAQVHAKCIEIDAAETVKITTDKFELNANGTIDIKSKGKLKMASDSQINFNDTLLLGETLDEYVLYSVGKSWMQELSVGGTLNVAKIQDEGGGEWTTEKLSGFTTMESLQFHYVGNNSDYWLEDGVRSFGTASADAAGKVTIPYYTFSGGTKKAGDITFNMADTAWFKNWYDTYMISDIVAARITTVQDSGSSVSATFRLTARNSAGANITSQDKTITMGYTPSSADVKQSDIQIGNYFATNSPSGTALSKLSNTYKNASTDFVQFTVTVLGTTKYYYLET